MDKKQTKKFTPIKITEEDIETYLPDNIKQTDVLTNEDKKVLATLVYYNVFFNDSTENGYFFLTNESLQQSVGIRKNNVLKSVQTLMTHNLIERISGNAFTRTASKYKINWDNLEKPLKKLSFKDMMNMCKPKIEEQKKSIPQLKITYAYAKPKSTDEHHLFDNFEDVFIED